MRESLFEQLKKKEISFVDEMIKINNLLNDNFGSALNFFEGAFIRSPFNIFYENFESALLEICEYDGNPVMYNAFNLKSILSQIKQLYTDLTLNSFLNYLEFFKTLLRIKTNDYKDQTVLQIEKIIEYDCKKLGYGFCCSDNKTYKVYSKHPVAEAVALKEKESTRRKIYNFLMIKNGYIEEKRECIKSLADDIEIICKKHSNISEYSKLKQFVQCVRHTKDKQVKEFPFYYEDEEHWLDLIFEMIIGVLAFSKTKEITKNILDLEKKNNEIRSK